MWIFHLGTIKPSSVPYSDNEKFQIATSIMIGSLKKSFIVTITDHVPFYKRTNRYVAHSSKK